MKEIAVLVSGGGTNLQAIIDAIDNGHIRDTRIALVLSNNADAYALKRAKEHNIPAEVLSPKMFDKRKDFEAALTKRLMELQPSLIVLAGFLVNLPKALTEAFEGKIINIHPSLIPSFCGKGYYGRKVHEAALTRGVKISGATVHMVDEGIDTGRILAQKAVPVLEDDTPDTLQRRIMEEAEWVILPKTIDRLLNSYETG